MVEDEEKDCYYLEGESSAIEISGMTLSAIFSLALLNLNLLDALPSVSSLAGLFNRNLSREAYFFPAF